jgi:hypothetical protein
MLSLLFLYGLQRLQDHLLLDAGLPGVESHIAWNTAVSFVTNTNWQAYSLAPPRLCRPRCPGPDLSERSTPRIALAAITHGLSASTAARAGGRGQRPLAPRRIAQIGQGRRCVRGASSGRQRSAPCRNPVSVTVAGDPPGQLVAPIESGIRPRQVQPAEYKRDHCPHHQRGARQ